MITSFPPRILLCIDAKYGKPRAYIHEDALQLVVDDLAVSEPDAGWENHDISEDETLRATLVKSEDGITAIYKATLSTGEKATFEVSQFDRKGGADAKQIEG